MFVRFFFFWFNFLLYGLFVLDCFNGCFCYYFIIYEFRMILSCYDFILFMSFFKNCEVSYWCFVDCFCCGNNFLCFGVVI